MPCLKCLVLNVLSLSLGGLNLSRSFLDRESRSQRCQRVSLDMRENLDSIKKCASTVEKSRSRSRLLDFVSKSMSQTKSLAWIFVFSSWDFSICRDFSSYSDSKGLNNVKISQQISTASQQISTISTCLNNLDKNLDVSKSWLKSLNLKNLDWEKQSWSWPSRKSRHLKKFVSTLRTFMISIDLDCRDPQAYLSCLSFILVFLVCIVLLSLFVLLFCWSWWSCRYCLHLSVSQN